MSSKLKIIQELMEELQDEMQMGEEDFSERLGKKKPGIEVVKVEGEIPMGEDIMEDEEEMDEEFDPEMGSFMSKSDPTEMLKKRLMKMRGK